MSAPSDASRGDASVRVSIVVTSYQHEQYIARALDSVLCQEGVSFEVLVGDDASTDASRAIIAEYAARHPGRIRTFFPESNLGLEGKVMLNELLERARGEYIAKLDGDDYWTSPFKLRRQVTYLDDHPNCSVCFHNVVWRHEDSSRPDVAYNSADRPSEVDLHELLGANPVASCSPVFRREAIVPLPGWFFEQTWGDWQLLIIAARHGRIHYLPECMGVHVTQPKGMWSRLSWLEALEGITRCQEGMQGFIPPELEWRRRDALAETWVKRAVEHARLEDRQAARECLRESFRVAPLARRRLRRGTGEKQRVALWIRLSLGEALVRRRPPLDGVRRGAETGDRPPGGES